MSVPIQVPLTVHQGNGVSTVFPYQFLLLVSSDAKVTVNGVLQVLGLHYSLTGVGNAAGGSVVFTLAPASLARVVIRRDVGLERLTDYQYAGDFQAATVNKDFDRLWLALQDYALDIGNALRLPADDDSNPLLPDVANRALKTLGFDAAGALTLVPTTAGDSTALALALASSALPSQGVGMVGIDGGTLYDYFRLKSLKVVASVAEVRLLSSVTTRQAFATAYAVAGDMGGGVYRYDATDIASADNGGTILVATDGGRWKLTGSVPTVHTFGARGDGTTDDKPAFLAMQTALLPLRLLDREYNVNGLALSGTRVAIIGTQKPRANSTSTKLENGSVLLGHVNIRSNSVYLESFGLDGGSARGVSIADGLVVNANVGETGVKCVARNLSCLGFNEILTTHALLVQGFSQSDIEDIDVGYHQYGVVVKGRDSFVRSVRGTRIKTATVFIKSDTPALGGDVLSAQVDRAIVDGVISSANPANTECNAVYVQASSVALQGVSVSNVRSTYGNSGLRVAGGGTSDLTASGVQFSNIQNDSGNYALDIFGITYDVSGSNVSSINPITGKAVRTSGSSENWSIDGINLLISNPAIVATVAAEFNGAGMWDNFTTRNPFRQMTISAPSSTVISGNWRGDAQPTGSGNLGLLNGWVAGTRVPQLVFGPGNYISLRGWAAIGAATNDVFATMPVNQTTERLFACAARKTDTTMTTVSVYVSGTTIKVESGRTGLSYIDLGGVAFKST